jgi:predicted transporter
VLVTPKSWPSGYRVAITLAALAIISLYLWLAQATNEPFEWKKDGWGFYTHLGRSFAHGQLHLPFKPNPKLLALPDPWDPERNEPYRVHDAVLYNQRYYLYHGAAPAVMLFAPWRLLTHHDMPEPFAGFLFCVLGFLFSCGLLLRMLSLLDVRPPLWFFTLLVCALGICQSIPFLLQRVFVYEIPTAAGYFTVSAGFYFFARGLSTPGRERVWLAPAGLLLGTAIGCRPHLAFCAMFAGVLLLYWLYRKRPLRAALGSRELLAFALPVAFCALLVAAYNYARFGNPLEFGLRYLLVGSTARNIKLARENVVPGLYYMLVCPPEFERVFPFVRLAMRLPFHSPEYPMPARYFLEPIAGVITTFPLVLVAFAAPLFLRLPPGNPVRATLWAMYLSSLACCLFIAGTGLSSERYEVDFVPYLVLSACVLTAAWLARLRGAAHGLVTAITTVAILYGIAVGLSLGFQGPYDRFVEFRSAAYVRLARWFSPAARFRPLENPRVEIEALFEFPEEVSPGPLPLVAAGRIGSRYALWAESTGPNKLRLVSGGSRASEEVATAEVGFVPHAPNRLRFEFTPEDRFLTVHWNGAMVLRYPLSFLVTAPAQVTIGEDQTELGTYPQLPFPGRVTVVRRVVGSG